MKFLKGFGVACMLMIFSLTFFACQMPKSPPLSCSGSVTISNVGLEGVVIKSNVKEYATTLAGGEFSFNTNAQSLTIYPYKQGYMFSPESATLTAGENSVSFVAIKVQNLTGTLSLNKIIITPTSIVNTLDNYQYMHNGQECLKASSISLAYNGTLNLISNPTYLAKSQKNEVACNNAISFKCGQSVTVGVLINTYFTSYHQEWQTSDSEYTNLYITKPQTNKDLKNNQIIYNMYGINNKSRSFTFDIAFVFDYIN